MKNQLLTVYIIIRLLFLFFFIPGEVRRNRKEHKAALRMRSREAEAVVKPPLTSDNLPETINEEEKEKKDFKLSSSSTQLSIQIDDNLSKMTEAIVNAPVVAMHISGTSGSVVNSPLSAKHNFKAHSIKSSILTDKEDSKIQITSFVSNPDETMKMEANSPVSVLAKDLCTISTSSPDTDQANTEISD